MSSESLLFSLCVPSTSGVSSYGTQPSQKSVSFTEESDSMKRAAAKKLIERYFYQLLDGCGNPNCDNVHCASSGKVSFLVQSCIHSISIYSWPLIHLLYFQSRVLTPNQAAAQAIQLFSQEARLCDTQPNKVARTSEDVTDGSIQTNSSMDDDQTQSTSFSHPMPSAAPGHSGLIQSKLSPQHEGELPL